MFELAHCSACGERIEWHWSNVGARVPVDMGVDHDPAGATLRMGDLLDADLVYVVEPGLGTHVDHRDVCAVRRRHPSAPRVT